MVTESHPHSTWCYCPRSSPRPEFAVEGTIADGLDEMALADLGAVVEVGDGPRHPQDAIVRAGRQAELVHRGFQQLAPAFFEHAVLAQLPRGHAAVEHRHVLAEARLLHLAGVTHLLP